MALYPSVSLSVCHKPVFYQNMASRKEYNLCIAIAL